MLLAAGLAASVLGFGAKALYDTPTMEHLANNLEEKCNLAQDFRRLVELNDKLIKDHGVGVLDIVVAQDPLRDTKEWSKKLVKFLSDKLIPRTNKKADLELHCASYMEMLLVTNDFERLRDIIRLNTPVRDVKKILCAFDKIFVAWCEVTDKVKAKEDDQERQAEAEKEEKKRVAKEEKETREKEEKEAREKQEEEENAARAVFRNSRLAAPPENLKALEEFFAAGKADPIESFFEDVLVGLNEQSGKELAAMQKDLIDHRGATLGSILRSEGCTESLGSHIDAIFSIFAKRSGVVLGRPPVPAVECKVANMSMEQIQLSNRLFRKLVRHVAPPEDQFQERHFGRCLMPVGGPLVRELLLKSGMHDLEQVEATLMEGEFCRRSIINNHIRRKLICHNAPAEMMWLAQVNQAFYGRLGMGLCGALEVANGSPMEAKSSALHGLMFDTPAPAAEAKALKMAEIRERLPDFGKEEIARMQEGIKQCERADKSMEEVVSTYLFASQGCTGWDELHYLVNKEPIRFLKDSDYANLFARRML